MPSLCMECCGARVLSEASFTDWSSFLLTLSANARSSIILYVRDLCGIAAIGLVRGLCLRVWGGERESVEGLGAVRYAVLGVCGGSRCGRWCGGDAIWVTGAIR